MIVGNYWLVVMGGLNMIDKKEAYEILGVGSSASKNDIERRYSIILKKYRMTSPESQESSEAIDIDKVTGAYNLLMGYEEPQTEEDIKAPNPILKKIGIDEKKASNFFHYYKIHILIGIITLVFFAVIIRGCVTKVDPDFNVAFLGQIVFNETTILKETIQTDIPEIKEPGFDGAFISTEDSAGGQQEYSMQMKAMILLAAADVDLFVLDKASFDAYAEQGAFISLDEIAPRLEVDHEKSKAYTIKANEDTADHIYGIDISNSEVLNKSGIQGKEMIAAIPVRGMQPEKVEKAERVIGLLLRMSEK